jgi:prevent-host-death family protein
MATVSALEAKTRLGKLLDRVARGEEIVITRHERPVARMVPEGPRRLSTVRQAVTDLRQLQERIRSRTKGRQRLSDAEVRSAIAEGRRPPETANTLLVLARRGKLTEAERQEALSALEKLSVELDHDMASLAFGKLSDLASKYRLSIYDAAYLELALRSKLPLACKDGSLREAAKLCRVKFA